MIHDQKAPSPEIDNLQLLSAACRARLAIDPCDLATRLSLSWHLLFQGLHYKHQQMFWSRLLANPDVHNQAVRETLKTIMAQSAEPRQGARRLFHDSLMQASMVRQLSVEAGQRQEALKILELAGILGESQVVEDVDREAGKILARVARAICAEKREKLRIPHRYRDDEDVSW